MVTKICQFCKNEFETDSSRKKFCSTKCISNKWKKSHPEIVKTLNAKHNKVKKVYNSQKRKEWYKRAKNNLDFVLKTRQAQNLRKRKVLDFLRDYKLEKGCADCGYNTHHAAMDFDHVRDKKSISVCNAKSIQRAIKEIEKCEVVCSNCHRIRTFNRINKKEIFEETYDKIN